MVILSAFREVLDSASSSGSEEVEGSGGMIDMSFSVWPPSLPKNVGFEVDAVLLLILAVVVAPTAVSSITNTFCVTATLTSSAWTSSMTMLRPEDASFS